MGNYGIIASIIIGAIAGWIASKIMGKDAQMGTGANIIVGVIGGGVGNWIFSTLFNSANPGLVMQIVYAVLRRTNLNKIGRFLWLILIFD